MILDRFGNPIRTVPQKTVVDSYGRLQVMEALEDWNNPDDLARDEGLIAYDEVVRDLHVKSVWNTRVLALRGCTRQWHPASGTEPEGNAPFEFVQWMFEEAMQRSLSAVCEQVHRSGTKNGYAVQELIWAHDYPRGQFKGATTIIDIKDVDPDRVILKPDGVYLKQSWGDIDGKKQHPRKFWIVPFQAEYENPYGTSLFQEIRWYAWFKKSGFKFWLVFLEKFGMPTVKGTIPENYTDEDEVERVREVLETIRGREAITVPFGFEIDLLEASKSGSAGAGYDLLIGTCNREISKAILGQTLTTEEGKTSGSYAQSKVHNDVRGDLLKADGEWFDQALNFGPVTWALDYNFQLEQCPYLKTETEPGEDLNALAERDSKLVAAGVKIPQRYFYETYNIPEPEPGEAVASAQSAAAIPSVPSDGRMAEPDQFEEVDEKKKSVPTDALFENALTQGTPVYIQAFLAPIRQAQSFEQIEPLDALDSGLFADYLHRVLVTAHLLGRVATRMRLNASATGRAAEEPERFADEVIAPFPALEGYDLQGGILTDPLTAEEALEFIEAKEVMPSSDYYLLEDAARRTAFAIADVEDIRVLEKVKDALASAVQNGDTFETFRQTVEDVFAAYGVDSVSTHHLETLFRTNIQTAYHDAAFQQIYDPALGDLIEYLQYDAIDDSRTRPAHAAVDGVTKPKDDPFWAIWWPPNGFRCRCDVLPITKYEAARSGITDSGPVPKTFIDNTGRKPKVYKVTPDKGFDGAPQLRT